MWIVNICEQICVCVYERERGESLYGVRVYVSVAWVMDMT